VLVLTLVTPWQASLIGYVLVGLGCANIAPALFSLAGHQTRMPGALAITAVSTLGFAGILAGPALIGFAANSLRPDRAASAWPRPCCWWRCPRAWLRV
jgi:MFS family permease